MIWLIFTLLVLTFISYFLQNGTPFLLDMRFPFLNAHFINTLILFCIAIMMLRILKRMKKKEKETLAQRIKDLEAELKALREKGSN